MARDLDALLRDAETPAPAPQIGLETPFEEVEQQDGEAADHFALFGPAHALDFLGDLGESASATLPARSNAA
jgi:hypothetical protein